MRWRVPAAECGGGTVPDETQESADELRRCIRDLAALATLPEVWANYDADQIAQSICDVLVAMLGLEFALVASDTETDEAKICVDAAHAANATLVQSLRSLGLDLLRSRDDVPGQIDHPLNGGMIRIAVAPVEFGRSSGLIAGSRRAGFPTRSERLIISIGANQAAAAVNRSRLQTTLEDETRLLETLNRSGATLAAELDLNKLVQAVTDAGVALIGAKFGAFFYNVLNERGESYTLYTLSGAPREAFEGFPMPRNTPVFEPTFRGTGIVRSDDITKDQRYGKVGPYHGQPPGHLPVRSYLAVPVLSRSGEVLGGLFFGHEHRGVFTERAERLIKGIAAQAAIAIDNARLYQAAQREVEERRVAEAKQRLLLDELNHRVKNTLATVQSIAMQTRNTAADQDSFYQNFNERLHALSCAHDLLTSVSWDGVRLTQVLQQVLAPYGDDRAARISILGPDVRLNANAAITLNMAFHELATNAAKYGALSTPGGEVSVTWKLRPEANVIELAWIESKGPTVRPPGRRGFGSKLIERGVRHELEADVELIFAPEGCRCRMTLPVSEKLGIA